MRLNQPQRRVANRRRQTVPGRDQATRRWLTAKIRSAAIRKLDTWVFRMWYRFHLKSYDPAYRPFLIAITRVHHRRDQEWSERLLEESEPCLLCIDCEDEKEARWFKNQIERAIPFWWLHYNPHTV